MNLFYLNDAASTTSASLSNLLAGEVFVVLVDVISAFLRASQSRQSKTGRPAKNIKKYTGNKL